MFVITGTGRAGTTHMAMTLREAGIMAAHEGWGDDGYVGWPYLLKPVSRREHTADVILHQLRHPLKVIASMKTASGSTWKQYEATGVVESAASGLLQRCAECYIRLTDRADAIASWRFQIEQLPEVWDELVRRLGFSSRSQPEVSKTVNQRAYQDITWGDLELLTFLVGGQRPVEIIREKAARYGYGD